MLVVSDDVKAKNATGDLGLDVLGILDFLRSCHGTVIMSVEEVKSYLPSLRRNFEIAHDFLSSPISHHVKIFKYKTRFES